MIPGESPSSKVVAMASMLAQLKNWHETLVQGQRQQVQS